MPESSAPAPAMIRERFALQSCTAEEGKFSIIAISAGSGNGWDFPADVLRTSLPCRHCRQRQLGSPAERLFGEAPSQDG